MHLAFSFLISVLFILLSAKKISKNLSDFINIILFSYVLIIFSTNSQNNDYEAYLALFDDPSGYAEIGYIILVNSLKYIGFESHRSVLTFLSLLVVFTLIRMAACSRSFSIFFIFYIVLLLPLDVTQIRNTFCVILITNALLDFNKKRYINFLILWMLGCSFHLFGFLYGVLIIIGATLAIKDSVKLFIVPIFSVLLYFVLNIIINNSIPLNLRTIEEYLAMGKISSVIIWVSIIISYLLIIQYFSYRIYGNLSATSALNSDGYSSKLEVLLVNIIWGALIFSPGLYYFFEFNRLYRFILFLMIIHSSIIALKLTTVSRVFLFGYYIILFFGLAYYYSSQLSYDYILYGLT